MVSKRTELKFRMIKNAKNGQQQRGYGRSGNLTENLLFLPNFDLPGGGIRRGWFRAGQGHLSRAPQGAQPQKEPKFFETNRRTCP